MITDNNRLALLLFIQIITAARRAKDYLEHYLSLFQIPTLLKRMSYRCLAEMWL
jgi:hypothetical protein